MLDISIQQHTTETAPLTRHFHLDFQSNVSTLWPCDRPKWYYRLLLDGSHAASKLHSSIWFTSQALKGIFLKPKMSEKIKKKNQQEKTWRGSITGGRFQDSTLQLFTLACTEAQECCQKLTTQRPHKWWDVLHPCEPLLSTAAQTPPRAALVPSHYLWEHCNRTLSLPCTASKVSSSHLTHNMLEFVQDIGTLYPKLALQFTEANV